MKSELASMEVGVVVNELEGLVGAKIDKIYQLKDKDVVLQLHKPNVGKLKVRITPPRAVFLTEQQLEYPEKPMNLCLQLRKHLEGGKVLSVDQLESERIIVFKIGSASRSFHFFIELFSKGNLILSDENLVIVAVAERQIWSDRRILPGIEYRPPRKKINFFDANPESLVEIFDSSDRDSLVKSLAMDIGLGGVYSEEICLIAGLEKGRKPNLVDKKDAEKIVEAINALMSEGVNPSIVYEGNSAVSVVPFDIKVYKGKEFRHFETFSKALDHYYSIEFKEPSASDRRIEQLSHILEEQESMMAIINNDIGENTTKGDAIYHNYQAVKEILDELVKARKKYSWKEIKEKLKGHKVIKEIDEKQGKVVVEL